MVGPLCRAGWGCKHETCAIIRARIIDHPAARAATFLLTQLDWIRWHADAVAYVEELSAAAAILRRCVDTPPKMVIVGMCDCSKYLYAYEDQAVATCKECGSQWEVAASRKILEEALVDRLCTAAEAAVLLMKFEMTSNRDRSRKNIVMWAQRGLITAHGEVHGSPTYRLGDIIDRASNSPDHQVYYVKVGNLIKIGTTDNVTRRMHGYPPDAQLLAVEPGGTAVETSRLRQFDHLLAHRKEWFHPGADLLDHIETVRSRSKPGGTHE
jgi:hypothetical protein